MPIFFGILFLTGGITISIIRAVRQGRDFSDTMMEYYGIYLLVGIVLAYFGYCWTAGALIAIPAAICNNEIDRR